jgi:hypothetical protein
LWALEKAPDVPSGPAFTLVVVASYAGQDGRGAYPTETSIARQTRKSERQVRRDLAELQRRGLLLRGDQNLTAHLRADRRPVVYDLAMSRADVGVPPLPRHGGTSETPRADIGDRHGGTPTSAKEEREEEKKKAPAPGLAPDGAGRAHQDDPVPLGAVLGAVTESGSDKKEADMLWLVPDREPSGPVPRCEFTAGSTECVRGEDCPNRANHPPRNVVSLPHCALGPAKCALCRRGLPPSFDDPLAGELAKLTAGLAVTGVGG